MCEDFSMNKNLAVGTPLIFIKFCRSNFYYLYCKVYWKNWKTFVNGPHSKNGVPAWTYLPMEEQTELYPLEWLTGFKKKKYGNNFNVSINSTWTINVLRSFTFCFLRTVLVKLLRIYLTKLSNNDWQLIRYSSKWQRSLKYIALMLLK